MKMTMNDLIGLFTTPRIDHPGGNRSPGYTRGAGNLPRHSKNRMSDRGKSKRERKAALLEEFKGS